MLENSFRFVFAIHSLPILSLFFLQKKKRECVEVSTCFMASSIFVMFLINDLILPVLKVFGKNLLEHIFINSQTKTDRINNPETSSPRLVLI